MAAATVTVLKPRDRTNAERQRRWRERQRNGVNNGVDPVAACALAGKLESGHATAEEVQAAGRLILALVTSLPA
jgi:hypothetical protein